LATLSAPALKAMETPLILNSPAPLPPSEMAVARLASDSVADKRTPPRALLLATVLAPLLLSLATWRKLLESVALPRTTSPAWRGDFVRDRIVTTVTVLLVRWRSYRRPASKCRWCESDLLAIDGKVPAVISVESPAVADGKRLKHRCRAQLLADVYTTGAVEAVANWVKLKM